MPGLVATRQFESALSQIIDIIEPAAKALLCLESSHSTTADVYLFWLAMMASLQEIISEDKAGLDTTSYEQICTHANMRFNKMINNAPTDAYLTAFALDPR